MSASNASIGDKLKRAKTWEKLSAVAEEWRQSRSHDLDGLLIDMQRGCQHKNRAQIARAAVRLRSIQEKLTLALASIVRESCWTDEEEDTPEEIARWAVLRQDADAKTAAWAKDFLTAIRNLELGLMFDDMSAIREAVAALPPAKKTLFDKLGKLLEDLKRG